MLKIENTEVYGWEAAIRGMRNPMNSWEQSDSKFRCNDIPCEACPNFEERELTPEGYKCDKQACAIGLKDYDLMRRLRNAGTDHRKFMRMITVSCDLVAPLYWWKEYDTYKVGTVANSCSTMHKIHAKRFELDDFSHEHLDAWATCELERTVNALNFYRKEFLETKGKTAWWQMIQMLPTSYNQRRTVMLNYEVLANIYKSRRNHKLDEWHTFCEWIEGLPYSELITGRAEDGKVD